ncbi:hypothetical protein NDU88_003259 [Pleurodeles waltl]|uniref:Uncharacterized protein n=1 Tax=Pleurodeles waltl TaxID=8319 RepID=A0AAV7LIC7_PLEWA|nr:hypothetical protein NDU88_003259 [Pleurodeles waltl]
MRPGSTAPAIACSLRRLPQRGDLRSPPLLLRRSSSPLPGRGLRLASAQPGPVSSVALSLPAMAFLWGIRPWPNTPAAAILLTSSSGSRIGGIGPDSARNLLLLSAMLTAHHSRRGAPPQPFRARPGPMSGCAPLTGTLMEGPRPRAPWRASPLQAVVRAGRSISLQRSFSPVSTLLHGRPVSLVVRMRCRYFYWSFIGALLFLVYSEGQLFHTF